MDNLDLDPWLADVMHGLVRAAVAALTLAGLHRVKKRLRAWWANGGHRR